MIYMEDDDVAAVVDGGEYHLLNVNNDFYK